MQAAAGPTAAAGDVELSREEGQDIQQPAAAANARGSAEASGKAQAKHAAGSAAQGKRQRPASSSADAMIGPLGVDYQAGNFNEQYKRFISSKVPLMAFKDARAAWLASPERAGLLATLTPADINRRRFK